MQLVDAKRRHLRLEILEIADLCAVESLSRGHADGNRNFLQRLLTLGRRDDDDIAHLGFFFERGIFVRIYIRILGNGHAGQCERCGAGKQGGTNGRIATGTTEVHRFTSLKTVFWSAARSPKTRKQGGNYCPAPFLTSI